MAKRGIVVVTAACVAIAFAQVAFGKEWRNVTPETRIGGRIVSPGYLQGKVVLLDCRDYADASGAEAMKRLQGVWRTYASKPFVVLGCHTGRSNRAAAAAQQTEILQHADRRVEEERARFKERAAEVVKQCNEEMDRNKAFYDERYKMTISHCDQRVADIRAHMADIVQEKRDAEKKMSRQYARNRAYLRSSVRNLCIAGGILLVTNIFFGAYAIFAYTVFDMQDPTRGLHRETHSIGPMMLFLAIVAICVAGALVVSMLAKKPKHEEEE